MSTVIEPGFCYCSCHTNPGTLHGFPCCDGQCPHCGRNVERNGMEEHLAEHQKSIERAMKELGRDGQ